MFGKLFGRKAPPEPLPEDPDALVAMADRSTGDPWRRRALIERAAALSPDSLKARYALLMLGDLGTGKRGSGDFSRIKSYILTPFEKPGEFSEDEKKRLAREIFDHPLLMECMEMSGDGERFLKAYLRDLTEEYAQLFILSSSAHSGAVLGFSTPASRLRAVSAPFAAMLSEISACPYLDRGERRMLLSALAGAAHRACGGDMEEVRSLLDPALLKEIPEAE